jgi:hypothetical protein
MGRRIFATIVFILIAAFAVLISAVSVGQFDHLLLGFGRWYEHWTVKVLLVVALVFIAVMVALVWPRKRGGSGGFFGGCGACGGCGGGCGGCGGD